MTQQLRSEWALDVSSWVASAQAAGKVTQTEAEKMQRTLKYVERAYADIAKRVGDVQQMGAAHKAAAEGAERAAGATAGMTRELLVLGHELSQGQYKRFGGSLLVLAEYSSTAKNALSALVGPLGIVAAVVGLTAAQVIHGAIEQDKFNKMLVMTGNYAGLTADRLNAVAAAAAKAAHSTIGEAMDATMAAAGTGRVGPEQLQSFTNAVLLTARVTGQTADEVVKDFAQMRDGAAKWAEEHNKSVHFITAAQYELIRRLEETGQAEKAQQVVLDAWNDHLKPVTAQVGYLATAWEGVKAAISGAAHALQEWGKDTTGGEQLQQLKKRLAQIQAESPSMSSEEFRSAYGQQYLGREQAIAALQAQIGLMARLNVAVEENTKREAERKAVDEKGVAARKAGDDLLAQTKSHLNLKKELTEWQIRFNDAAKAGAPFSAEEQKAITDQVRRKYTPPEDKKLATEIQNLIKSLSDEEVKIKAETEYLKQYGRAMDNARLAVLKFRVEQGDLKGSSPKEKQRLLDLAGNVDSAERGKREAEALAHAKQMTDALIAEAKARALSSREEYVARILSEQGIKALNKESAAYLDLADAAGKKYDAMVSAPALAKWAQSMEAEVQKIDAQTAAMGQGTLAAKLATVQTKLLAEAQAEAAKYPERHAEIWVMYVKALDAATAAEKRQYDVSRSAQVGSRTAITKYVEDATNQAKNAESLITGTLRHAEDAFIDLAKTGRLSLGSLFSFMAEEYLRQLFRMTAAKTLFDSSGSLLSLGSIFSNVANFFTPHASGLQSVPYDGYPAILHEGERVLTKTQNAASQGGGISIDMSGATNNIGQGVSRAEVVAGMGQAHDRAVTTIVRRLRNAGISV